MQFALRGRGEKPQILRLRHCCAMTSLRMTFVFSRAS